MTPGQPIARIALVALLSICAGSMGRTQTADIIAVNGRVFTASEGAPGAPLAEALAIKGEKFIAVGSSQAMRALAGPDTKVIDLGGRFVTPGLADGHFHNEGGGAGLDLSATRSLADL